MQRLRAVSGQRQDCSAGADVGQGDVSWTCLVNPEGNELCVLTGRPMVHDLRATLDAINYVTRYGIEWRALPVDFPPYEAVYAFFLRCSRRGLPERLTGRLRGRLRVLAGRGELPTAGCIDSQTVKAAETVGAAACGYDGGKKLKGQNGILRSTRSGCSCA